MRVIYSIPRQNYLASFGVLPDVEFADGGCGYRKTPELQRLLDRYIIERYLLPNKL